MHLNKRWFLPLLVVVTLLLAACGGAAATPTPVPEDTTAAPTTATDSSGDTDTSAVATKAPAATKAPTAAAEPTDEPTEEAAEPTEEAGDDTGSDDTMEEVGSLDSLEGVNSYRFSMELVASGEAFEANSDMAMMGDGITIEGAIVKEPPAQDIQISLGGAGGFGFRLVDGKAYTSFGDEWIESDESEAPDVGDIVPVTPEEISTVLDKAEKIGEEDVDGRPATHYHVNKEQMAEIAAAQGNDGDTSFDFADAEEAEMDFWLDEEFGFISKMDMHASGAGLNEDNPELEGLVEVHLEYTDINEDIEIEVPELSDLGSVMTDTTTTTDTDTPTDTTEATSTAADLEEMLGFAVDLPADTSIDIFFDIATITVPLPLDETQALFVDAFEANGFTLDEDNSYADFGVLQYDNGDKTWSVTLSESDDTTQVIILPVTQ